MTGQRRDADVIVIGAGAGGLTAAAYLATQGREVIVVDRQSTPGGNMAMFTHNGYEFDIGLHYLGGAGDVRPTVRGVLEPLGIDLRFHEQDPDGFDTLLFADMAFAVPRGVEAFRERLHEHFPRERVKIDRFLRRLIEVAEETREPHAQQAQLFDDGWERADTASTLSGTLGAELDRLDCSPRLRVVLSWLHFAYGAAPSRVAFATHARTMLSYLGGVWYPEGGAQGIRNALVEVIRRHGGEILLDTQVSRILVDHGAVRGVRLLAGASGRSPEVEELRAPAVVAAGDLKRTFLELLAPDELSAAMRRRAHDLEMAAPLFVVYLVLDRDLRAEGMPNRNWAAIDCDDLDSMYASWRHGQLPAQQYTWISITSVKDPSNPRLCRPGQTNLQLLTGAPASHEFWGIGPRLRPGARYTARKRELRDRAVRHAERAIPGLGDAIVYEDTATPITIERHLGSTGGTPYGIAPTPAQFGGRRPGPRTPIDGLFLAGASTRSGHGITGAMRGGAEAASAVVDATRTARVA